jgi:hypothetical protein
LTVGRVEDETPPELLCTWMFDMIIVTPRQDVIARQNE